ncbi:MAG: PadR family transcriptional regulator [Solirubrobacterales bacterium]|nr:PadR family transcriptional regulator [Solirubrobacterales bacterium]
MTDQDDLKRLAVLQHYAGGRHFGRGSMFGSGRGRRRRGDVRIAVLMLLADEPRNGYQLMQTIEQRSGGRWRPSPGSVYPSLAQLEDEGLIRAAERDGVRLYEITATGRKLLGERSGKSAPWEPVHDPSSESADELETLVIGVGKAASQVAEVGDENQRKQACHTLADARRTLYRILAEDGEG